MRMQITLQRTAGDAAVQRRLFQAYWNTAAVLIGQDGAAGWSAALADTLPGPPSPAASGAHDSLSMPEGPTSQAFACVLMQLFNQSIEANISKGPLLHLILLLICGSLTLLQCTVL